MTHPIISSKTRRSRQVWTPVWVIRCSTPSRLVAGGWDTSLNSDTSWQGARQQALTKACEARIDQPVLPQEPTTDTLVLVGSDGAVLTISCTIPRI